MKRFLSAVVAAVVGVLVIGMASALAQDGGLGGMRPQTELFNDALLLGRILPFLVALGIGFGVWQGRASLRRRASSPTSPNVTRHDIGTVISHWANGIGFIAGIITGALILRWIQRPDLLRSVFAIHYIGAGLVLFGVASHLAQHAVTGGMGLIPRSLRDVREALGELVEYAGIFGPHGAAFGLKLPRAIRKPIAEIFVAFGIAPPARLGKFLPAEKVLSYVPWAIIITVIVVTGLIKALRYLYPISPAFVAQMTTLHDLATIAAVVMLAIHLAAVLLVPRNWPLLFSMFTTRVSRKHVEKWHPLWFKQLAAAEQKHAPTPAPEVTAQAEQGQAS